ncbi:Nucleic acid-binding protein [Corchorus olitorius]|uniref:Nucleic acid-binding protein n=1 Tax=Corchorus olitorius TaxID=93759 RepID=A0A1R3K1B2_9ROSI|nr:Nucleic acid-binding protein [Corchorus olitorius]
MNPLTIHHLCLNNEVQTIKLRISRRWDCVQTISRMRYGIAFVGIDYQIFKSYAHLFRNMIIEGNVYQITNFIVPNPQILDVSTRTSYFMFSHENTIIHQVSDPSGIYPRHFFDFTGENNLDDENIWETHLTDVIGVIKSIVRTTYLLMSSGNSVGRKDIKVMTLRKLAMSLWEILYITLDIPMHIATRPRLVVIFSGMRVRNYYVGISLTSTSASRAYVNLDIPETS